MASPTEVAAGAVGVWMGATVALDTYRMRKPGTAWWRVILNQWSRGWDYPLLWTCIALFGIAQATADWSAFWLLGCLPVAAFQSWYLRAYPVPKRLLHERTRENVG